VNRLLMNAATIAVAQQLPMMSGETNQKKLEFIGRWDGRN